MPPPPAVTARNVSLRRNQTTILHDLTCDLPAGRCTALLGPNGCGKTTFTRLLLGHAYPTAGRLTVLAQTLGQTNVHDLRQRVALVNAPNPLTPTVDPRLPLLDAVCTGTRQTIGLYHTPSAAERDHAAALLQTVGLATHTHQPFATCSTGEQRRALVARALIHQPELLILDEPTAGLDVAGREHLLATLQRILTTTDPPTVLMITHHVEELPPATTHVLLMRDGHITHAGPPQHTLTNETLSDTFGCPVTVRQSHSRYWLETLPKAWLLP